MASCAKFPSTSSHWPPSCLESCFHKLAGVAFCHCAKLFLAREVKQTLKHSLRLGWNAFAPASLPLLGLVRSKLKKPADQGLLHFSLSSHVFCGLQMAAPHYLPCCRGAQPIGCRTTQCTRQGLSPRASFGSFATLQAALSQRPRSFQDLLAQKRSAWLSFVEQIAWCLEPRLAGFWSFMLYTKSYSLESKYSSLVACMCLLWGLPRL